MAGAQRVRFARHQSSTHPASAASFPGIDASKLKSLLCTVLLVVALGDDFCPAMSLDNVKDVDLDPSGVFKYILIKVVQKSNNDEKFIVRGYGRHEYHAQIFRWTKGKLGDGFKLKCVGGGRIKHEPNEKTLFVYGYSQAFGQADHKITVELLKKKYTDYSVTYSNEGY